MSGKKEYTETQRYKSTLTGEYIMAHQWVAEVLIERKAKKFKTSLPHKFWLEKNEWTKEFVKQTQQAARLIKKYGEESVTSIIRIENWTYSLYNKDIIAKIREKSIEIKNRSKETVTEVSNTTEFKQVVNKKKTLFGKLK